VFLLGAERRAIWGRSDEDTFAAAATAHSSAGGRSTRPRSSSRIVEPRAALDLQGGRRRLWRNYDGQQTWAAPSTALADRDESAFSPGVTLFKVARRVSLTAAAYRAFRAPTLNELYRPFRVGNVLTIANST
jgi:outer membrane receptor protein involved in Fe transport